MPAEYILNLLLILNLAWRTTELPLAHWKQAGSAPLRPQPQYKQSIWNSSSQCTTDSKCLEKELSKITRRNRIRRREAPGSMSPTFFDSCNKLKLKQFGKHGLKGWRAAFVCVKIVPIGCFWLGDLLTTNAPERM